jgi:hypothetical protein
VRQLAHDLANPLAALHTLVELADPDPLLLEALGAVEARLALFRLLFGGDPDRPVPDGTVQAVAARLADRGIHLQCRLSGEAAPREQRAALALVLTVSDLLAGAGTIAVADGPEVGLSGRCRPPLPPLVAVLAGQPADDPQFAAAQWAVLACGPFILDANSEGVRIVRAPALG